MRPTLIQRFFANHWPLWVLVTVGVIGCMGWSAIQFRLALQLKTSSIAWFVLVEIISCVLGFFLAFLVGALVLPSLYDAQGLQNGAPYQIGDHVRILTGKHQNEIARVYERWESRRQIRVELGKQERIDRRDVFSYVEVCREPPPP